MSKEDAIEVTGTIVEKFRAGFLAFSWTSTGQCSRTGPVNSAEIAFVCWLVTA